MRQWIAPRALLLHLIFLIIAGGCFTAAWWQVHRAMDGNTLSYLYSIEWPAFVGVASIGWWQMVHDTPEDIAGRRAFHERMRAASAEVVARTLPAAARAITVGATDSASPAPALDRSGPAALPSASSSCSEESPVASPGTGLASVSGPADADLETVLLSAAEVDPDAPGNELSEYNRYLAYLAVKGRPKTWRNPRGTGTT